MTEHHPLKPFYSVLVLAFVCSALVATAAVGLKSKQERNRVNDQKKHILYAANLFKDGVAIEKLFEPIHTKIVDLSSGKFIENDKVNPSTYNQLRAALSEDGLQLKANEDIARIKYLEKYSLVYLVVDNKRIKQIILPVRGKGLWSTMYAYVALGSDFSTINGISFYQHGETPGLGGEVDNIKWQEGWRGKSIFDDKSEIKLRVIKGVAKDGDLMKKYKIDGLSGATLTTKGIDNILQFWFSDNGFKPLLARLQKESSNG